MTPARQNTRLYSDFPHLPSYGVSIPHGEQCPAALPSIIDGNHPLGLPGRSEPHDGGELFQQIGKGPPQLFIVPLQSFDLLRVNAAVGIRLDRHLV